MELSKGIEKESDYIVVGYSKSTKTITAIDKQTLKPINLKYDEQLHGGIINKTTGKVVKSGLSISCYSPDNGEKLYTIINEFDGNTTEFDLSDTKGNVVHMSLAEIIKDDIELTNGRYEKIGFETVIIPKAL